MYTNSPQTEGMLIQKFEVADLNSMINHLLELKQKHPMANFFVHGVHQGFASGKEFGPFSSQLMRASIHSNQVLICGNPWAHKDYYASWQNHYEEPSESNFYAADFNFKEKSESSFVWILKKEIMSYEMRYKPLNNKEATTFTLLEKWEEE